MVFYKLGALHFLIRKGVNIPARELMKVQLKKKTSTMDILPLHVKYYPLKTAIIDERRAVTYQELYERALALAGGLKKNGIRSGMRVGVCMRNRVEYLEISAAVSLIKCGLVPISWRLKKNEIEHIIKDSGVVMVFADDSSIDEVERVDIKVISTLEERGNLNYETLIKSGEKAEVEKDEPPELMMYTAGTTGFPKGAKRDLAKSRTLALMIVKEFALSHFQNHLVVCPLYHAAPTAFAGIHLMLGSTIYLMDKFDLDKMLNIIEKTRINTVFVVPYMVYSMMEAGRDYLNRFDLSSLQRIICAGAPLREEAKIWMGEYFKGIFYEFYGSTETGIVSILKPGDVVKKPASVGHLAPGVSVKICDDKGKELRKGEVGEICVKCPWIMDRYHGVDMNNYYYGDYFRTGDAGFIDKDGYLYVVDRVKDMIISGGVNIFPAEIENVIMEHPDVKDVAVVGYPDQKWGEAIAAFVVKREGSYVSEEEIVNFVASRLASFKKPKEVIFVESIPVNPQGKVLKRELRRKLVEIE